MCEVPCPWDKGYPLVTVVSRPKHLHGAPRRLSEEPGRSHEPGGSHTRGPGGTPGGSAPAPSNDAEQKCGCFGKWLASF